MPKFAPEHVAEAFETIRRDGIPAGFGPSIKWDIIDEESDEAFPPKAVLFLAKEFAGDATRSGGGGDVGTNNALRQRGFSVVLKSSFEKSQHADDVISIITSERSETMKKRLVNARLGQGGFREALLEAWNRRCAITGLDIEPALRASHIKPWRSSNDKERLDPANGLLLAASVDALFDRHLISFDSEGRTVVNRKLNCTSLAKTGLLPEQKLVLSEGNKKYLEYHRAELKTHGHWTIF